MEFTETRQGNVMMLGLNGKMDSTTAPQVELKLSSLIDAGESRLIMDFTKLNYVSSAGLRVFLVAARKLERTDGRMCLAGVQAVVMEVFEMAGFDDLFEFFPSPAEAVKALG